MARPPFSIAPTGNHEPNLAKAVSGVPGASYNRVTVPLSDHEQRILDEIEKNLYEEDPRFARQVKEKSGPDADRRKAKLGAIAFVAGFLGLLLFFYSGAVAVGVFAFIGMVTGVVLIAGWVRGVAASTSVTRPTDRVSRALNDWEKRVRERYKRD